MWQAKPQKTTSRKKDFLSRQRTDRQAARSEIPAGTDDPDAIQGIVEFSPDLFEHARLQIEKDDLAAFQESIANMSVNMQDPEDQYNTLLHWAVGYNRVDMVRALVASGAALIANEVGMTPLELATQACESGDQRFQEIKQVLSAG